MDEVLHRALLLDDPDQLFRGPAEVPATPAEEAAQHGPAGPM
jgi:hypothetical protein